MEFRITIMHFCVFFHLLNKTLQLLMKLSVYCGYRVIFFQKGLTMRTAMRFIIVIAAISMTFVFCSDNDELPVTPASGGIITVPAENALEYFAGDWKLTVMPMPPIIQDSLVLDFNIKTDSTYTLQVIDPPEKILFSNAGTWSAYDTVMYLSGDSCAALDTATNPDSLKALSDSICSAPITIPMRINTGHTTWTWTITGASLGPAVDAFPIPADAKATVKLADFTLEKQ
jgi:hypothetical protein